MKKMLSVLLAAIMLLSVAVPAFAVETSGADVPIVYVQGQGTDIINSKGENVFYAKFDDSDYLFDAVKDCIPSFMSALLTDTDEAWAAYSEQLWSWLDDGFGDFFLDKNGEPLDGTHVKDAWDGGPLENIKGAAGYGLNTYIFPKDWRLDPIYNAALLNDYIEAVMEATGSDKVNLVGRCEGADIVLAYLAEYGENDYINCVVLYASSVNGVDYVGSLFSGNLYFDSASLKRYKDQALAIGDEATADLIDSLIEFATDTFILDTASVALSVFMKKVYTNVLSDVIRKTYGTLPGIWSLVPAEDYDAAIERIFGGYEEEYAGLIEKLDRYNVTVRQRADEIITEALNRGVKIANFVKYGEFQTPPLSKANNKYSDGTISVELASMGAYSPRYGSVLSDSYINNAKKKGTDKYISPDRVIDASTCLLPDTTWFIYNSQHKDFTSAINTLMVNFLRADGEMTVFSDPAMPQYLVSDASKNIVSMTDENGMQPEGTKFPTTKRDWKDMIMRFLNAVATFIKQLLSGLFSE